MFNFKDGTMPSFFMSFSENLVSFLSNTSAISTLMPLAVWLINFRKISNIPKPILILIVINPAFDMFNLIRKSSDIIANVSFSHFFTVLEFTIISFFYAGFFSKYFNKHFLYGVNLLFLIMAYIDFKAHGLGRINNLSITVECVTLTTYALLLFYFVLRNLLFENLFSEPIFWINSSVLIYFAGNLLFFTFINYVPAKNKTEYSLLWSSVHAFFNLSYNVFLAIGIWKAVRK